MRALYLLFPWQFIRLGLIIAGGIAFQFFYGGLPSVMPIAAPAVIVYLAGRSEKPAIISATIAVYAMSLVFYKYTAFLILSFLEPLFPTAAAMATTALQSTMPATVPLGISFFTRRIGACRGLCRFGLADDRVAPPICNVDVPQNMP